MYPFEFKVIDSQGLWGGLRFKADTVRAARRACRTYLLANEVSPNGSLEAPFKLVLLPHT